MSWIFRVWKWCFGYGLDYSICKDIRVRIGWSDNKSKGVMKKIHFSLLLRNIKKHYMILDDREFVGVTEKFNGKYWYDILFTG